jgi:hypothetical protein
MTELKSSQRITYVLKSVLKSPLSLAVLAAGGVVSFLMGSPLPLLAAGAVELFLIWRALQDEDYLRKVFAERQEQAEVLNEQQIETLLERMDFETRQRIRYILQLQRETAREARAPDAEPYARQDLERIASRLQPLVQQALQLGNRRQKLARYMQNMDERALTNYCNSVRQKIETTTDPVQKAQYEQALKAREAELQTYKSIAQATARIDSQLENVEATFANWKAKVIRIKTADVGAAHSVSESLFQEMESMGTDISSLDQSVSAALAAEEEIRQVTSG